MRIFEISVLAVCLIATAMAKPAENQALQQVSEASNAFAKTYFENVRKTHTGNLITSSLSAEIVLAMASYGADGNTKAQLQSALHQPTPDSLAQTGYQSLIDNLNNVKDVELRLANKIFVNEKFSVKPTFTELTQNYFRSASQLVDFTKPTVAAATINNWAQENTNGRITEILPPQDVDPMTALVLVNAIYFKGQWKNKFDAALTQDMTFHVDETTEKKVPTMFRRGTYKYGELRDMNAKFVVIPYKGDELSMLIILPNEINGLNEVERKLQETDLKTIMSQGYEREVELHLPKFKIESKIDLEENLKKMGMVDMFDERANFSGIADAKLVVSKVVQKAFIEVNEEGSEAAAVTGMQLMTYSLVFPVEFAINRPFIYSIVHGLEDKETDVHNIMPLFSGHVTEPQI